MSVSGWFSVFMCRKKYHAVSHFKARFCHQEAACSKVNKTNRRVCACSVTEFVLSFLKVRKGCFVVFFFKPL